MKNRFTLINSLAILLIALLFASCNKQDNRTDDEIIQDYLSDNNLSATKLPSGVYYLIEEEGNGEFPNGSSNLFVFYKGYDTGGNVFDERKESEGVPMVSKLSGLILGWQYALPYFDKGSRGKIFIPAELAYNEKVLIFDIYLYNFN